MTNNINKKDILEKITPVIEDIAHQLGLIVLETNFVQEAGRWCLKIFIYSQDHPITHVDCENLTRGLNGYLDPLVPIPYYLEVSSPGLEKTLKSTVEYNIFRGKKVEIKLKQPEEGLKKFLAKIIDYNPETGLKVQVLDTEKEIIIKDQNISSVKLKADFLKYKGD
ncbi:MAG: hypothetical protein A2104_01460 [Candidatus Melainabacteria bacterium GWF2_32_7]|nr:MAG: hypothetical protein A2104_01460 [Candidatus Melainabacteria bacterium GWF2_32_7]